MKPEEFGGSIWGPPRPDKKRKKEDDKTCGECILCEERKVDNEEGERNQSS